MDAFVTIDGSQGGGQMLRNAAALSAVSGRPVRVINIRRGRPKPGLRPQHLLGLRAVAEVCGGELAGAELGSTAISLQPRALQARPDWRLDVGTAGSITLLLQSLLPALARAPGESHVTLIGGTDVPYSPPYDYFAQVFVPAVRRLGIHLEVELVRRGFYPKGGGEVRVHVTPAPQFQPISWLDRGPVTALRGRVFSVGLPSHIAERMRASALAFLSARGLPEVDVDLDLVASGPSQGCGIVLWAETESGIPLAGSALGERGVPAERVGEEAARHLLHELDGTGAVDSHLADQLLVYLALANGPSEYTTSRITDHMTSAAHVAEQVVGAGTTFDLGPPVRVHCTPA